MKYRNRETKEVVSFNSHSAFADYINAKSDYVRECFRLRNKYKEWDLVGEVNIPNNIIDDDEKKYTLQNGSIVYKKYVKKESGNEQKKNRYQYAYTNEARKFTFNDLDYILIPQDERYYSMYETKEEIESKLGLIVDGDFVVLEEEDNCDGIIREVSIIFTREKAKLLNEMHQRAKEILDKHYKDLFNNHEYNDERRLFD